MQVDEDDPVVAEVEVVMEQAQELQLQLLQYPLRPKYRPYGDEGELTAIRMQTDRLEMDYQLRPDTANFARKEGKETPTTHTLSGSAVPMMANYCVGLLKDQVLHLTPITSAFQLRPSFQFLTAKELPEERVELQAKVGRKRPAPRNKGNESWTSMDFKSSTDSDVDLVMSRLTSSRGSMQVDAEMKSQEYVDMLLPAQRMTRGQLERIHSKDWHIQIEEILSLLRVPLPAESLLTFLNLPESVTPSEALQVIEEKARQKHMS